MLLVIGGWRFCSRSKTPTHPPVLNIHHAKVEGSSSPTSIDREHPFNLVPQAKQNMHSHFSHWFGKWVLGFVTQANLNTYFHHPPQTLSHSFTLHPNPSPPKLPLMWLQSSLCPWHPFRITIVIFIIVIIVIIIIATIVILILSKRIPLMLLLLLLLLLLFLLLLLHLMLWPLPLP